MEEAATRPYVLGHSDTEFRRLAEQSAFFGELTEEVFQRAGIGPIQLRPPSSPCVVAPELGRAAHSQTTKVAYFPIASLRSRASLTPPSANGRSATAYSAWNGSA